MIYKTGIISSQVIGAKLIILALVMMAHIQLIAQCGTTITQYPYQQSFESGNIEWTPLAGGSNVPCGVWTRGQESNAVGGSTPTKKTGPSLAADGSSFLYTEANNCINQDFFLTSPCFDLSNKDDASFQFSYHMYGKKMGSLAVEVSLNNGVSWNVLWSISGEQQLSEADPWTTVNVSLGLYEENVIRLRIHGVTGDGVESDMAVDNFQVFATEVPCKWKLDENQNVYYDCENVGIGTDMPVSKLDVRGITTIGTTDSRNYLAIKSNMQPEIQFSTPSSSGDMRIGVSETNDAAFGIGEGDFYVRSASLENSMPLIVTKSGNISLVNQNGNVGIGTSDPGQYKLAVEGTIGARKVKITTESWADYVFLPNYDLKPLLVIEAYIQENGHLPNIPAAEEVIKKGIDLGIMNVKLMEKIEELTLYLIDQEKRIQALEKAK